MKHAKDRNKRPYTLYLEYDLMNYIYDNIKGVSASQFINDLLFKEIKFLKLLEDYYKNDVKALDDLCRKNKVEISSLYGEVKSDAKNT